LGNLRWDGGEQCIRQCGDDVLGTPTVEDDRQPRDGERETAGGEAHMRDA